MAAVPTTLTLLLLLLVSAVHGQQDASPLVSHPTSAKYNVAAFPASMFLPACYLACGWVLHLVTEKRYVSLQAAPGAATAGTQPAAPDAAPKGPAPNIVLASSPAEEPVAAPTSAHSLSIDGMPVVQLDTLHPAEGFLQPVRSPLQLAHVNATAIGRLRCCRV